MEIDRNSRIIRLTEPSKLVAANDDHLDGRDPRELDPDQRAVVREDLAKVPRENSPTPRYGGLHRLAIADFENAVATAEPDFSRYRLGFNNRDLLGSIAKDLNTRFGVNIHYGYGASLEAFANDPRQIGYGFRAARTDGFHIGEKVVDKLVEPFEAPIDRRAVATFAIAHEFFHSLLRHPDVDGAGIPMPKGWRIKKYEKYRALMEIQVDYLAARYLRVLGLPLDPVMAMFQRPGEFPEGKDYPSGEIRAANVASAKEAEFRLDLFSNEIVDCLDFLESLV